MSTEYALNDIDNPLPSIVVSGLSHKATDISLREKLAVPGEQVHHVLEHILLSPSISEAVIVNTCNRIELITTDYSPQQTQYASLFEQISGANKDCFNDKLYILRDNKAVSHIFRVAAGLDSMVLGEPQILGQLKSAYQQAHTFGSTSICLNRLFHRAFRVAKVVRSRTAIGRRAVSIAYAARLLAEQIFENIADAKVLLIGAGETGQLVLRHFWGTGVRTIFIANRSLDKATRIASEFGAIPLELNLIDEVLDKADIVVCAAERDASQSFFITRKQVARALSSRQNNPQFYIDLGVPRGLDPEINNQPDAFIYNIDDLGNIIKENQLHRANEAEKAEIFIDREVDNYCSWLDGLTVERAIAELSAQAEIAKSDEISKTLRRLQREKLIAHTDDAYRAALEDFSSALVSKLYHQVKINLKDNPELLTSFRKLLFKRD